MKRAKAGAGLLRVPPRYMSRVTNAISAPARSGTVSGVTIRGSMSLTAALRISP